MGKIVCVKIHFYLQSNSAIQSANKRKQPQKIIKNVLAKAARLKATALRKEEFLYFLNRKIEGRTESKIIPVTIQINTYNVFI